MKAEIPIGQKFLLTITEASAYFNIGIKQMRRIAEEHRGDFVIFQGNRYLIVRRMMEEYIIGLMKSKEGEDRI